MTTTKRDLEKALELAIKSIISGEYTGCYEVCKRALDNCAVRHSTEEQLKVCVNPMKAHFLKLAKGKR